MLISAWLKGLRRKRLDENDFDDEIRAHLAIAADEKQSDGADPRARSSIAEGVRQRHADHRGGPPRLDAVVDRRLARPGERCALRGAGAREKPGVCAHRHRRAHAWDRPERRGLHDVERHDLQPDRRRHTAAQLAVIYGETSTGRDVRVSYPDYQYLRDHDHAFSGLSAPARSSRTWAGAAPAARSGRRWSPATTFRFSACAPSAAARSCRRTRSRPAAIPSSSSATVCGVATSAPTPDIVGRTVEINNYPLTIVGVAEPAFHGTTVVYDVEVFVPVMMAPQLGFGSQQTSSGILSDRRAAVFFPQGFLRPGVTLAAAAAQIDALSAALTSDRPLSDVHSG